MAKTIPRMTPELEHLLGVVEKDIAQNINLSRIISSLEDLEEHLNSL